MKTSKFLRILLFSTLIYFFSWAIVSFTGINSLTIQSEDTVPTMFIPVTLIKEGTLYLDTYYQMILHQYPQPDDKTFEKGSTPYYVRKAGSHYVSAFPIITGILAIPVYFFPVVLGMPITLSNLTVLAHISAALITALSGSILYVLLKKHLLKDDHKSMLLTIVYLFGTINFALMSQALWQHGTLELFLLLGLYLLFEAFTQGSASATPKQYALILFASIALGLAVLTRPTAALSWIFIALWMFERFNRDFSKKKLFAVLSVFLIGLFLVLVFFVWYNGTFYLSLQNQGYYDQLGSSWLSKFPEGFLGVWLSPSKGILIYSPVFIFSLIGFYKALRRFKDKDYYLYIVSGLIVLLHTLVIGWWKHWFGGWSFGYRMSSDVIPFLVLMLVPYVQSPLFEKTKKLFYALTGFSIFVQIFGIVFFDGVWHAAYDRGFDDTSWLWSIKDSEFVFNVRRVLVKLHVLQQACPKCL